MQIVRREKTSTVTSVGPACYKDRPFRQDVPCCDTDITVMGTTNSFQTIYEVCSTGSFCAWYCKLGQMPKTREVIGSR